MYSSKKFSIDEVGKRLIKALNKLGWKVEVETDSPREFKHYFASKRLGILEVFVLMEILLGIIDADPNYVDVIFIFYADPNITGKGRTKIPFRKKQLQMMQKFLESSARKFLGLQTLKWNLMAGR